MCCSFLVAIATAVLACALGICFGVVQRTCAQLFGSRVEHWIFAFLPFYMKHEVYNEEGFALRMCREVLDSRLCSFRENGGAH